MSHRTIARTLLQAADRMAARRLDRHRERPALLAFAFHHLFADRKEVESGHVDPHQPTVERDLEEFLDHFLTQGYQFVSVHDVADGLEPGAHYAMVTFDDGYHSALRALAVLRRFEVPGTFFISTAHVVESRAFWWDVLFRERTRRGASLAAIRREKEQWLGRPSAEAEAHVRSQFGTDVLVTRASDSGRTLTPGELTDLARDPLVTLGNHTADHAVLTFLDAAEARSQIRRCQDDLAAMAGVRARAIAYPNGAGSPGVEAAARAEGLDVGVTIRPHKIDLPVDVHAMALGRFCLSGDAPVVEQCRVFRSNVQFLHAARRLRQRARSFGLDF